MRILAIRGKNLASLAGEFAVSLEEGPLAGVGLFAITGPTGAGKSTLLDALCLALYDAVPRLSDGSGAAVGRADEAEELRLKGNDVRGILRRGTAEGWAEVDFLGGDGRRYRARWEVRRARGRAEGRLQPQTLTLCDLETGQFLGRTKTEVLEAIQERIGLSFDQFRRSALLAQGDFAAFLKARPAERAELLERITGTGIYGALSRAAHLRASQEKTALAALEERLGDLRPLDDEERARLERRCEEAAFALRQAEQDKERLQALLDGHRRLKDLLRMEEAAEGALRRAEATLAEAAPRREELERTERAQALRGPVQAHDEAAKALALVRRALEEARREHVALQAAAVREDQALAEAEQRHREAAARQAELAPLIRQARELDVRVETAAAALREAESAAEGLARRIREEKEALASLAAAESAARDAFDAAGQWLEAHGDDAVLGRQWELWDDAFRRYARGMKERSAAEEDARRLEAEGARLEEELRKFTAVAEEADARLREMEDASRTLEGEAALLCSSDLPREREELERRSRQLRSLADVARETLRLREEHHALGAALEEDRRRAATAGEEAMRSTEALDQLNASLAEARRSLEAARLARKEEVEHLRARLRSGEPCPVCGALEHPWAGGGAPLFDRFIDDQEARAEALEKEAGETARRLSAAETTRKNALQQAQEKEVRLARLEETLAQAGERWAALDPAREGIVALAPDADVLCAVTEQMESLEQDALRLREREQKERELRRRLDEARRAMEAERRRRDDAREVILDLRRRMQEAGTRAGAARAAADAAARLCREAIQSLADPLGPPERWEAALEADPRAFFVACRNRAEEWRREEARRAEAEKKLQELAPRLSVAEARCRDAEAAAVEAQRVAALRHEALELLRAERRSLLAGESADAVERRLEEDAAKARQVLESARPRCAEAHRRLAAATRTVEERQSEVARREDDLREKRQALDVALAAGAWDEAEARRLLERSLAWIAQERQALDRLEAECREARVLLRERREQTVAHRSAIDLGESEEAVAARLQEAVAALSAARNAWGTTEGERQADDRRREQAGRLQEDLARQRERWRLWEGLRELIGSADGSKFRSYAQSLTLDVLLAHANRHLEDLARRYALERAPGSDLDLQIVDREMADEVRPVHSLSGGESFLVSLALALALASLSSHRTQVESLFVDEGFGSLDPDTLDTAVASLDALQSLGRKVGVISHVPALVERIGVQVRVESLGSGRSRVRIVDGRG